MMILENLNSEIKNFETVKSNDNPLYFLSICFNKKYLFQFFKIFIFSFQFRIKKKIRFTFKIKKKKRIFLFI